MFTKNYRVLGKHATYIRFLNAYAQNLDKKVKAAGIFAYAVDVYMVAPLIGAAYKRKAPVDTESKDDLNILAEQFISRQKQLDDVYRLVMLSDESVKLSDDERIDRAFKTDEDSKQQAVNLEIFHQYMRGGVEWLYERITEGTDYYLDKIKDFLTLYADDFQLSSMTENLDEFLL
jgi:hypothetical protein